MSKINLEIDRITAVLEKRAERILEDLAKYADISTATFYIAGNALNNTARKTDIDLFPIDEKNFDEMELIFKPWQVAFTKNAGTYILKDLTVQVCRYFHINLDNLIYSFDYSHIQVGAKIRDNKVQEIRWSTAYLESRIIGNSEYVGSKYPLSSLIRAVKYKEYKEISKGQMIIAIIFALADVVERGFKDYDDFKDQLDAVDLGLLPEDFEEFKGQENKLTKLFEMLRKDK